MAFQSEQGANKGDQVVRQDLSRQIIAVELLLFEVNKKITDALNRTQRFIILFTVHGMLNCCYWRRDDLGRAGYYKCKAILFQIKVFINA